MFPRLWLSLFVTLSRFSSSLRYYNFFLFPSFFFSFFLSLAFFLSLSLYFVVFHSFFLFLFLCSLRSSQFSFFLCHFFLSLFFIFFPLYFYFSYCLSFPFPTLSFSSTTFLPFFSLTIPSPLQIFPLFLPLLPTSLYEVSGPYAVS